MATARIGYDPTTTLGATIRQVVRQGVEFRKGLQELNRVLDKYIDATADITTDTGVASGNVTLFRNLVNQAQAEAAVLNIVQVDVGSASAIRQLLDAMG